MSIDVNADIQKAIYDSKIKNSIKLRIVKMDGDTKIVNCDTFEFRTNYSSNLIRCKSGDNETIIHGIATISF